MKIAVGDLEANGLLDTATTLHCGVFKDINTGEVSKFSPLDGEGWEKNLLDYMSSCDVCIMHNGIGYDWPLLEKLYGYHFPGKKVDTLIMSRLHKPNRLPPFGYKGKGGPHSIEAWGYRVGRWKPEYNDWSTFTPEMLHRCTEDVEILHLVYNALLDEQKQLGGRWREAYLMTFNLFEILHKQEEYGWLVDQDHLNKSLQMLTWWKDRIDRALAPRLPRVYEIKESGSKAKPGYVKKPFLKNREPNHHMHAYWGQEVHLVGGPHTRINYRPLDLSKRSEVVPFLLKLGWEPREWNTNDAGETTSPKLSKNDPFDGVQGSLGRLIARRLQCVARYGILKGWKEKIRPDGRLPSVVTGIAATGRAKHQIIVNTPNGEAFFGKWMRKCFIAAPGKVLVGTDAAGCQDRMLAQRAGNVEFMEMLLNGDKDKGTDGHSLAMHGINDVLLRNELKPITRGKAKNFNYGFKFGASDTKLGRMSGGGPDVGKQVRAALNATFPAQAQVIERLTEEWKRNAKTTKGRYGGVRYKDGWFTGLDGRPVYVESEHAILVYCLQSDEAIMMSAAYVMLYKRLLKKGYKWGEQWAYVNWNHDEYTIECDEDIADDIRKEAEKAIADSGLFFKLTFCPQAGEGNIGRNWYEIH